MRIGERVCCILVNGRICCAFVLKALHLHLVVSFVIVSIFGMVSSIVLA